VCSWPFGHLFRHLRIFFPYTSYQSLLHFLIQTGNRNSSSDISRPYPDENLSITQKLGVVRTISPQWRQRYSREKSRIILRSASRYARLPLSGAASIQCLEEVASSKCTPTMTVVNEITECIHVCQKDCVGQ
jgi:hypothetical protein